MTGRLDAKLTLRPDAKLTLWPGVGLVAANMIGAGVFLSFGFMAQSMRPGPILLAWLVGMAMALCGALAYAELARLVPRSGGEYRYLSDLLHPSLGFLAGWGSLLVGFSAPIAMDALAAGAFAGTVFHGLSPHWTGSALVLLLTGLHVAGLRTSARAQNALVIVKALLLVGFVAVGLAYGSHAWPTWQPPHAPASPVGPFVNNLFYIALAFSGWNAVVYAAEDFKEPGRTVPKAMLIGCLAVGVLYLLVNAIFAANLTPTEASVVFGYGDLAGGGDAQSAQVTLAHALVARLLGPGSAAVMSIFTVLVFVSAMSAMIFIGPRVYAAMARDGYLPRVLAGEEGKPPVASVLLQGGLALLILWTHELRTILGNIGAVLTFFSALTVLGLFRAALRPGPWPRPRPLALLAAALYAASALALMVGVGLWGNLEALAWIGVTVAVGLVAYGISLAARRGSAGPGAAPPAPAP